jgi:hypothetical protein
MLVGLLSRAMIRLRLVRSRAPRRQPGSRLLLAVLCLLVVSCKAEQRSVAPPANTPPPTAKPNRRQVSKPELLERAQQMVREAVVEGFDSREKIIDFVGDFLDDDGLDVAEVKRITDEQLELRRKEEANWTTPTDCDRLDVAFAALEREGILARQNYDDTLTGGITEIEKEMGSHRGVVDGYVFYHAQDTERALGGTLMLAFGAREDVESKGIAVGQRIVHALTKTGLRTAWDGTIDRRIEVAIEWKKRRFTKAP